MPTYHLHINGCVQGVGFRPFVYGLANKYGVKGWVKNTSDGVHIRFNADNGIAERFHLSCISHCPPQARITHHLLQEVQEENFQQFKIENSTERESIDIAITPDFGICPECLNELFHQEDRRAQYSFITCTNCGPRYSIMKGIPYDREKTTMIPFKMCPSCKTEFWDPLNRRYYSQTNSCPECGVRMQLRDKNGYTSNGQKAILKDTLEALKKGEVIAVKGIGGYLLLCDATQSEVIAELRKRKQRPDKPFALMYPDIETLKGDIKLSEEDIDLLTSPVAPIFLAEPKEKTLTSLAKHEIAPGLSQLGVMLPYAPLFALITAAFSKPVIATSANLSGSPIVYEDDSAHQELYGFADLILSHDRNISVAQDDSVVKRCTVSQEQIIIRRSRGLAPNFYHNLSLPNGSLLCMGAELKGSFCLSHKNNIYVSQFLGDLGGYEAQQNYYQTLKHFLDLTNAQPQVICTDLHSQYFGTQFGEQMAEEHSIPVKKIQHHKAHFSAVLGENELLDSEEKVLGVIWDGTGLGEDDQIWGGEFFEYCNGNISRTHHFEYFPWVAGDKMAKEPRLSALSLSGGADLLGDAFTQTEWEFYNKAINHPQIFTSSAGRVFDAVASLLDLKQKSTYEGQAALLLEQLALSYFRKTNWKPLNPYPFEIEGKHLKLSPIIQGIISDILQHTDKGQISAKFHQTLAHLIKAIAHKGNYKKLAFSGGVFQNGVLMDLIQLQLKDYFLLHFHKHLSPNDENISFGQYIYQITTSDKNKNRSLKEPFKPELTCV